MSRPQALGKAADTQTMAGGSFSVVPAKTFLDDHGLAVSAAAIEGLNNAAQSLWLGLDRQQPPAPPQTHSALRVDQYEQLINQ